MSLHHPTIDLIIQAVADYFCIRPADILSARRLREFARPRQIAMFLAREYTGLAYQYLGEAFDRNHTTVMYGLRVIEARLPHDARLAAILELIRIRIDEALKKSAGDEQAVIA